MPTDVNHMDLTIEMWIYLINRVALLRRLADECLKVAQKRYWSNHDKKDRFGPIYAHED